MPRNPQLPMLNISNMDPELYKELARYAFETGRSKRDVVQAALREYMARHPWWEEKGEE